MRMQWIQAGGWFRLFIFCWDIWTMMVNISPGFEIMERYPRARVFCMSAFCVSTVGTPACTHVGTGRTLRLETLCQFWVRWRHWLSCLLRTAVGPGSPFFLCQNAEMEWQRKTTSSDLINQGFWTWDSLTKVKKNMAGSFFLPPETLGD